MEYSYEELLEMEPIDLLKYLEDNFLMEIPSEVLNAEDMETCSRVLLKASSSYSYLVTLLSYAKIATRNAKRSGDKTFYEDMVDRKEVIQNMTDMVKQIYTGVSRAVTIHIENNNELKSLGIV